MSATETPAEVLRAVGGLPKCFRAKLEASATKAEEAMEGVKKAKGVLKRAEALGDPTKKKTAKTTFDASAKKAKAANAMLEASIVEISSETRISPDKVHAAAKSYLDKKGRVSARTIAGERDARCARCAA